MEGGILLFFTAGTAPNLCHANLRPGALGEGCYQRFEEEERRNKTRKEDGEEEEK